VPLANQSSFFVEVRLSRRASQGGRRRLKPRRKTFD
jgi:hypothetical protein